jgi:hypothetical protein
VVSTVDATRNTNISAYVESSPPPGTGLRADTDVARSEVCDVESKASSTTSSRIMTVLSGKRDFCALIRFGSRFPVLASIGARGAGFDICVFLAARNYRICGIEM